MRSTLSIAATALAVAGGPAAAAVSFPPAGSNAFIAVYEIDSGQEVCDGQCTMLASPGRTLTLAPTTFDGPDPNFIAAGGSVTPTAMRGFLTSSSFDAAEINLAMRDTYTVVGGSGPFSVTARMHVEGVASGVPLSIGNFFQASVVNLQARIGTFNIDPAAGSPTVTAFPGGQGSSPVISRVQTSDFTIPFEFEVTHTRTVNPGDVFDLAWFLRGAYGNGEIDFQNTAAISFDTPDGVFLSAASGAQFGDLPTGAVPEPASWAQMLVGFGLGGAALRARRRQALAIP